MDTKQPGVIFQRDGAVARITFNRPEVLNAFNRDCALALLQACRSISSDADLRVVLIRGNGPAFMAGGDVRTFKLPRDQAAPFFKTMIEPFHDAMEILAGLRQPVIASLHGAVAGAGLSLAMAADLAVAADNTKFTMGYSKLGVSADGSISWSLPRVVGLRRAMEMALLSDVYGADDALRFGLINRVVPLASLEQEAEALVRRLAKGPTYALGKMKSLLRQSLQRSLTDQLKAESDALSECVVTRDFAEGVSGFLEKRVSAFDGE
jgi:2-(1,2-epoxy-1,2-dihydrophenyl)acetyl-CoA isomerase